MPTDALDVVPISNVNFGSNIVYTPPALKWIKLQAGTYQKIEISFSDQNNAAITMLDSNVSISVLIRNKGKIPEGVIPIPKPTLNFRL
jgi:hypothetical protein